MRCLVWLGFAAAFALGGCQRAEEAAALASGKPGERGRFVGVGLYAPREMWTQLARSDVPQDPAAATLDDDEEVIVVLDSATGEIRQCGNLSGHCIALNPWAKTASAQDAPAALLKHARQLAEEAEAEANAAAKVPQPRR